MQKTISDTRQAVWQYYEEHGRHSMAWRQADADGSFDPYKIMISEIMLQQTQVARVTEKYSLFLALFPTVQSLAAAELGDVLRVWQGLGYNRRAKYTWQAAQKVVYDYGGVFPQTITQLTSLPGIGKNTAGAIIAYSWSRPVVFIETNIRTVLIYHFSLQQGVSDKELELLAQQLLPKDASRVRAWYWALMDYGAHLKKSQGNLNKLSKSYTRQSTFAGSRREVRGKVIARLTAAQATMQELQEAITDERLPAVVDELVQEGLIVLHGDRLSL